MARVASMLTPESIPSRAMSVFTTRSTPISATFCANSMAWMFESFSHPRRAIRPSRASMPTTMVEPNSSTMCCKSTGFSIAVVPMTMRVAPPHVVERADAAAELHRDGRLVKDAFERLQVIGVVLPEGRVEVDHVQHLRALVIPPLGDLDGVFGIYSFSGCLPLGEPDTATAA